MILLWISNIFLGLGVFFFLSSVLGLLRFPDTLCRMHALAKADNLALGCVIFGAILRQDALDSVAKLLLIWFVTLLSSATSGFMLARRVRRKLLAAENAS